MSDKTPYLGNPQKTIEVIQKYEFAFQKKFGQNFLIDTHVLDKIISAAEITKDDFVSTKTTTPSDSNRISNLK